MISNKKTEVLLCTWIFDRCLDGIFAMSLHFSRYPSQCALLVRCNTMQQVEKVKYIGVAYMSDG